MFSYQNLTFNDLIARVVILLFALPVHECAHGLVAGWFGDPTARSLGRVTLNPLKHLDLFGSALLVLAGFGWAKPVPVNPRNFRRPRLGLAASALAGPFSNLLLSFFSFVALKLGLNFFHFPDLALQILFAFTVVNITLAIFNLLPIPPLDGSRILAGVLPATANAFMNRYRIPFMVLLMVLSYIGMLSIPMTYLSNLILSVYDQATFLFGTIFA